MMNRRQLTKNLAAALAASSSFASEGDEKAANESEAAGPDWRSVLPGIWKATLGKPEPSTPVRSRLVNPATAALASLPEIARAPIGRVQGEISNRGCIVRLPLEPGELIYGFGLQLLSFSERGKKIVTRVNADPKLATGDSHAPVPFYVSTRGYGVLVDSARNVEFDCGNAREKPLHPQAASAGEANTPETTRELAMRDRGQITVEVPHAAGVDLYLFGGPTMLQAVQRYNLFSGGGVVPPEWGLGFWYRAELHADHARVKALAQELREREIPCDVIGLEPGWQTHAYSCSFAWDGTRFPDPKSFLEDLSKQQFKANLWEHAFTHPSSPLFDPLLPHSGDYGVWGGLVPDFAGEPARRIFGDYHGRSFIDIGVSGFKLDECDNSDYTGGWSFPDFSRFPSGVDGEQMHSVFGLRYQDAIWQQFRSRGQQTYSLVRSSGALAAPYPFVLYSDLYDHRQFVRGLATAGFSGLLWCPEVRDAQSEEDLIRRLQSVVFSPLAMVNAWYIKNPPWKQIDQKKNNANDLAENWHQLEARCREIIGWRMQLVPYLRSAFERYAATGMPPFRALILEDPADAALEKVDDQYMIGDRMLVAPLFAGEPERAVILPKGTWHDFWTGKAVAGGSSITVPGSRERIPVFVKAGSILPLASVSSSTSSPKSRMLTVRVYGDGSLPWRLDGKEHQVALSWNSVSKTGKVEQKAASGGDYTIATWEQFGQG